MKKFLVFVLIIAATVAGFAYWFPIRGVWLDRWIERVVQQPDSAYRVEIHGASLRRTTHLHFDAMTVDLPQWGLSLSGQDVAIFWSRKKGFQTLHIQRFLSKTLAIKGGIRCREGSLVKAHLKIWIPQEFYKKIPNVFHKQMLKRHQDSRLGMRMTYSDGLIRIWGATGPLYEMSWRPYTEQAR